MENLVDYNWRPATKTSTSLIKLGYSQSQLNQIGKVFLQRFGSQTIKNASTAFYNMVRKEAAHNLPKPHFHCCQVLVGYDIANRSKDASEKAEAALDEKLIREQKIMKDQGL